MDSFYQIESQPTPQTTSYTPAIGLLVGFLTLIYFGWDKFWAWYESPLTEEWGWDEDGEGEGEDETTEKKIKITEEPQPQPKNWWEWIMDNKMRTISLVLIIMVSLHLVYKIVKLWKN